MEHRHEPRKNERLIITINGRDKTGHFFQQRVEASRISGALLSGMSRHVRPGDEISVAYGGKRVPLQNRLAKGLRIPPPDPSGYTPDGG
jgi:hypothetical protein